MRVSSSLPLAVVAMLAMSAAPAAAATGYSANLNWAQEPAGNCTTPSNGTGSGILILTNDEDSLSFQISYSGLNANSTLAHIHNGPPGVNGPVVFDLGPHGTLGATSGSFSGAWVIPAAMVVELKAGRLYINVHSEVCPSGEIRGQIADDPTPVRTYSWGKIKIIYR